jgi:hypothetical protein
MIHHDDSMRHSPTRHSRHSLHSYRHQPSTPLQPTSNVFDSPHMYRNRPRLHPRLSGQAATRSRSTGFRAPLSMALQAPSIPAVFSTPRKCRHPNHRGSRVNPINPTDHRCCMACHSLNPRLHHTNKCHTIDRDRIRHPRRWALSLACHKQASIILLDRQGSPTHLLPNSCLSPYHHNMGNLTPMDNLGHHQHNPTRPT